MMVQRSGSPLEADRQESPAEAGTTHYTETKPAPSANVQKPIVAISTLLVALVVPLQSQQPAGWKDPSSQSPGRWAETSTDPVIRGQIAAMSALLERQAKSIEDGLPSARVVRLPGANHYVFLSNEADVLREMRAFLSRLQ
jgi:hypothetical protein